MKRMMEWPSDGHDRAFRGATAEVECCSNGWIVTLTGRYPIASRLICTDWGEVMRVLTEHSFIGDPSE